MKRVFAVCCALLVSGLMIGSQPAAAADTVRPEVGKPLKEAQVLIERHHYSQALAKVDDADAVPSKTAYENFLIERMRVAAAIGAGRAGVAAKALDAMLASRQLSHDEALKLMEAVASAYYRERNYDQAIAWIQRYHKAGGADPAFTTLEVQAYYLKGDYRAAAHAVQAQIAAVEKAGRTPPEDQLQLLVSSQLKAHDRAGYLSALQQLVAYYPKPQYWNDLISQVQRMPRFADRLTLDAFRLRLATGTLSKASDYMEMAELALQAGFPLEAQQVIARAYAGKVFGSGPQAQREQRLKQLADQRAAEDRENLNTAVERAKSQGGDALVNVGYDLVLNGQAQRGLALMREAIAKDKLNYPEDAKLHLGLAYLKAGEKARAIQAFRAVHGDEGAGELARLWILVAHAG